MYILINPNRFFNFRKDLDDATILTVQSWESGSRLDIKLGRGGAKGEDTDAILLEVNLKLLSKNISRYRKLTVFDPDMPGTPIYRANPFPPSIPVNRDPTVFDFNSPLNHFFVQWRFQRNKLPVRMTSTPNLASGRQIRVDIVRDRRNLTMTVDGTQHLTVIDEEYSETGMFRLPGECTIAFVFMKE
eukprot:sb/3471334/